MPRKKKSILNKPHASLTFVWDKDSPIPKTVHSNVTNSDANNAIMFLAENLIASNPAYYELLTAQMKKIHDYMYNTQSTIH